MQIVLLSVLLIASIAFAGDVPGDEGSGVNIPMTVTACSAGTYIQGETNTTFGTEECDFTLGNSCQTKIEMNTPENFLRIDRECQQTQACENNAGGNRGKCFPGENNVRICFFCCETHLCNNFTVIPDEMP